MTPGEQAFQDSAAARLMAFKQRLDAKETPFVASSQYQPSVVRETRIISPLSVRRTTQTDPSPRVPWPIISGNNRPCCLYPGAFDPSLPGRSPTDFPATVKVVGIAGGPDSSFPTYGHNLNTVLTAYTGSSKFFVGPEYVNYVYSDTGDDSGTVFVTPTGAGWGLYLDGATNDYGPGTVSLDLFSVGLCLVASYSTAVVTDQFDDTYTVNGTDTITRAAGVVVDVMTIPSCMWTGPKSGGGMWKLDYGKSTPFKWHLHSASSDDDKTSPQNKPDGPYGTNTIS